ncbi:MAG: hypothetical protein WA364_17910 [Candidatus Nitrosopolaris sp.]
MTTDEAHIVTTTTTPPSPTTDVLNNLVLKKPVRLSSDKMGIVIHEPFVKALHIDDSITWVQEILTDQGLLLKPIHGMPSLREK